MCKQPHQFIQTSLVLKYVSVKSRSHASCISTLKLKLSIHRMENYEIGYQQYATPIKDIFWNLFEENRKQKKNWNEIHVSIHWDLHSLWNVPKSSQGSLMTSLLMICGLMEWKPKMRKVIKTWDERKKEKAS